MADVSNDTVTNVARDTNQVMQALEDWLDFDDTTCVPGNKATHYYPTFFGTPATGRVYRFNRVMVGAATLGTADAPQTVKDYLSTIIASTTQLTTLAGYSPLGGLGVAGASRSSDAETAFGIAAGGAQGVSGFGINDDETEGNNPIAVGVYGLVLHGENVAGASEGAEITAANAGSVVTMTPNTEPGAGGETMVLNLTAGWTGYTNNVSCFQHYGSSISARATKGRVIAADALDTSYGAGGQGVADEFLAGQSTRWLDGSDNVVGELWSDANGPWLMRINSATNTVLPGLTLRRDSSSTPANGIGVGLRFAVETAAANVEIGAAVDAIASDVTSTSEDFDLSFKVMAAGAAVSEKLRLTSNGALLPGANDGTALGASGTAFSDLFLAAGAVINFNAGDVTVTAGTNTLTFAGAVNGVTFNNPINGLDAVRAHNGTAIPAGGAAGQGFTFSSTSNFGIFFGSGAPTFVCREGFSLSTQ